MAMLNSEVFNELFLKGSCLILREKGGMLVVCCCSQRSCRLAFCPPTSYAVFQEGFSIVCSDVSTRALEVKESPFFQDLDWQMVFLQKVSRLSWKDRHGSHGK